MLSDNEHAMRSKCMDKYPFLVNVLDRYAMLISAAKAEYQNTNRPPELELRFGHAKLNGSYNHGIDRHTLDNMLMAMDGMDWQSKTDWVEQHDYFYTLSNGTRVRQQTIPNSDTMTNKILVDEKTKLQSFIMCGWHEHNLQNSVSQLPLIDLSTHNNENVHDFKVMFKANLSREVPIPRSSLPTIVTPSFVRIKQRQSYIYGAWRYDVTLTWSGTSKTDAEAKQHTCEPDYELEIECISTDYLVNNDSYYIATSMLLKANELVHAIHSSSASAINMKSPPQYVWTLS